MAEKIIKEQAELLAKINHLPGQTWPQKFEFNPKGSSEGLEVMNLDELVPDKNTNDPLAGVPYEYSGGIKVYDLNNI